MSERLLSGTKRFYLPLPACVAEGRPRFVSAHCPLGKRLNLHSGLSDTSHDCRLSEKNMLRAYRSTRSLTEFDHGRSRSPIIENYLTTLQWQFGLFPARADEGLATPDRLHFVGGHSGRRKLTAPFQSVQSVTLRPSERASPSWGEQRPGMRLRRRIVSTRTCRSPGVFGVGSCAYHSHNCAGVATARRCIEG
jgi:hypothetical protein